MTIQLPQLANGESLERLVRWYWDVPYLATAGPVPDMQGATVGGVVSTFRPSQARVRHHLDTLGDERFMVVTVVVSGLKVKKDGTTTFTTVSRTFTPTDEMPAWLVELIGDEPRMVIEVSLP